MVVNRSFNMFDPHKNIFYSYQGKVKSEEEKRLQLENNVTKAMINTLENSHPNWTWSFLKWLGLNVSKVKSERINYSLQRSPILKLSEDELHSFSLRIALALLPNEFHEEQDWDEVTTNFDQDLFTASSVPDAWIWASSFIILVESKINTRIDVNQLIRHRKLLGLGSDVIIRTWENVSEFFNRSLAIMEKTKKQAKDSSYFLINQFFKYLELLNLTSFYGFQQIDFDLMLLEDIERRKIPKEKLRKFMDLLVEKLPLELKNELKIKNIGKIELKENHIWATLSKQENNIVRAPHFTFSLNPKGFYIGLNLEAKEIVLKFAKILQSNREEFISLVDFLRNQIPFSLMLYKRQEIRPRLFLDDLAVAYHFSEKKELLEEDLNHILLKFGRTAISNRGDPLRVLYRVFFCKHYPRYVLELNDQTFVDHIVDDLKILWPLYRFVSK